MKLILQMSLIYAIFSSFCSLTPLIKCWICAIDHWSSELKTHEKTFLILTFYRFDAQLVCFALMFSARIWFLQKVVFPAIYLLFSARSNISFNVFTARLPVQQLAARFGYFVTTQDCLEGSRLSEATILFSSYFPEKDKWHLLTGRAVKTRSWTNQSTSYKYLSLFETENELILFGSQDRICKLKKCYLFLKIYYYPFARD